MRDLPICTSCWNRRYPDRPANTGGPVHGRVEECQNCGGLTSAMLTDVPRAEYDVARANEEAAESVLGTNVPNELPELEMLGLLADHRRGDHADDDDPTVGCTYPRCDDAFWQLMRATAS